MKDILILVRQRKDLYLTALVFTLLLTVTGALYNLKLTTSVEALVENFVCFGTYMNMTGVWLLILAIVALSHFQMNDRETKTFLETLPVKRVALELYRYAAVMGLLLINGIVAILISLIGVSRMHQSMTSLLYQFGMILLFLAVKTTVLFVGISLFKNWVVGGIVSVCAFDLMDKIILYIGEESMGVHLPESLFKMMAVFEPRLYFERTLWEKGNCSNPYTGYVFIVLTGMLLALIAILLIHANIRELSGGRIFYVNTLNFVLLLAGGFTVFILAGEWLGIYPAVLLTVAAEVVAIYFFYHKKARVNKLAPIKRKRIKNPILAQSMRTYMIYALLIGCIVEYSYVFLIMEPCRQAHEEMIRSGAYVYWDSPVWILDTFDFYSIYSIYGFLLFCIVEFILFQFFLFAGEGRHSVREFYATLPVKRMKAFYTRLYMDLTVFVIPFCCIIFTSIGYLLYYNQSLKAVGYTTFHTEICGLIGEQVLLIWSVLCIAIFIMGILKLIDAVTVGGKLKILFSSVTAIFLILFSVLVTEEVRSGLLYDVVGFLLGYIEKMAISFLYLLLGIVMLIAAGRLYRKREMAKEFFYYKPAKYVLAGLISLSYFLFVFLGAMIEDSILQILLAVLGSILLFCVTVYYCTPQVSRRIEENLNKRRAERKRDDAI